MPNAFSSPGPALDEGAFVAATLISVRRCPARADFIELRFDTAEGPWDWCFAEPTEQAAEPTRPLVIVLGRYGTEAHSITEDGGLGPALPSTSAMPMILAGAEVRIARRLVLAGR